MTASSLAVCHSSSLSPGIGLIGERETRDGGSGPFAGIAGG